MTHLHEKTSTAKETPKDDLPLVPLADLAVDYNPNTKRIIPVVVTLQLTNDLFTGRDYHTKPLPSFKQLATTPCVESPVIADPGREQASSLPAFQPAPTLGLGQWECQRCTFHNKADRPRHNCAACSSTPNWKAKLRPTKYSTSISPPTSHRREGSLTPETINDIPDGEECGDLDVTNKCPDLSTHMRVSAIKKINRKINLEWINLDYLPLANVPQTMWYTVMAPPHNINVPQKLMPLDDIQLLKKVLCSSWYAVQKGSFKVVGAWSLDRILHGVFEKKGLEAFATQAAASVMVLENNVNHHYKDNKPNCPIVDNTDDISG
jgi:hypothetical protein